MKWRWLTRRGSSLAISPYQVVTQGTDVSYDDQTLLDNLEYTLRVGGPATARFLGEAGNVSGITVRRLDFVDSLSPLFAPQAFF